MLETASHSTERRKTASTFHTNAEEIVAGQRLLSQTYTVQNIGNWRRIGLQILTAARWRPDCAAAERCDTARAVPPPLRGTAPIFIGPPDAIQWFPDALDESLVQQLGGNGEVLRVEVGAACHSGVGLSSAYVRTPEGAVTTQGWIVGTDMGTQAGLPGGVPPCPCASCGALTAYRGGDGAGTHTGGGGEHCELQTPA